MVVKILFLLPVLLNIGWGEGNASKSFLSYLKSEAESSLKLAIYSKNVNSDTSLNYIHFLNGYENLNSLSEMVSGSHCEQLFTLSDVFTNFSKEMKSISHPLNFWISEISRHIEQLGKSLDSIKHAEKLSLPYFNFIPKYSSNWSLQKCYIPHSDTLPGKNLDFNDITTYDERTKSCRGEDFEFRCGSGECIHFNKTCDGMFNCWDGSDELGFCHDHSRCESCEGVCLLGPNGHQCLETCPEGFNHTLTVCKTYQVCYKICYREINTKPLSTKCMIEILPNLVETVIDNSQTLRNQTFSYYFKKANEIRKCKQKTNQINDKDDMEMNWETTTKPTIWYTTTRNPLTTWYPTTRHTTWHPTTRHTTWHPTTRHTTWHPTTRHTTWHPTTRHTTWHPTTRHTTWHPTTRHTTWDPTTRHTTWHPTTRHTTWHPTTRHTTWDPTTRHTTWHPTTRHTTWHPTTRHTTWHPTTRHTTWHPTTRHTTWHPTTRHTTWHPTTRHTTWHPTTRHPTTGHTTSQPTTRPTTWDPTTRRTTWDPTTWNPTTSQLPWNSTGSPTKWESEIESFYGSGISHVADSTHPHTTKHTTHHTTKHTTHHTTKHTTHHTTKHTTHHTTKHTTHHTTKHTTHHTTKHTTHHTTKHTTHHTTKPTTPTTPTSTSTTTTTTTTTSSPP